MAELALSQRLKALIAIRALFVSLLLGSTYIFRIEFFPNPRAISFLIILLYSLTIAYIVLLSRIKNLISFAYIQLMLDVVAEISLIYITGGIESWFAFTLLLTVLSSSIVLNRKAGYIIASLSSILYGLLLDLQFYGVITSLHSGVMHEKQFFYNIFIHTISFYVTAYLAGYLSSRLEKTVEMLEETDLHLRDLELFNTKVIESLPSGLFTTDIKGKVLIFNRTAEKITGKSKESIIGNKIEDALPFLGLPFEEGRNDNIISTPNNEEKLVGITISKLRDISGSETGFIGIFQDLTELKKLEAEVKNREKWAAIGELSANIAHEIRNPLASLRGSIEMLKENRIPDKHRDKLMAIAIDEMERLNNIITDFLTYSSPKPLDVQKTDIHRLINDTFDLINNAEPRKPNVVIKRDFSGELCINADPLKLRQVFWNLALNAVESMKEEGVLSVSTREYAEKVSIIFSDTGAGIPRENLQKIFYPFFTTKEKGTGLGLAIAYRIIEEHNGSITVQSMPGIRTAFEIILPKKNET